MKVGFVHDHPFEMKDDLIYTTGGLPSSVWETYLVDDDISVYVIGRESKKNSSHTLSSHNRVFFYFSKYYNSPLDFWLHKKKIFSELEEQLIDLDKVIIRLPSFLGLIAYYICKKHRISYLIEVVGNAFDSLNNYNLKGKLIASYVHNLNKKAIQNSFFTTYVTENYLQRIYPNSNTSVGVSDVELNEFINNSQWNNYNDVRLRCGTVGNLEVKYKGYEIQFKVLKKLKEIGILVDYVIAGGGNSEYLKELACKYGISELVTFTGKLNRVEILEFYDSLDYYIHPSFQEGLPRVVVEAMSRGKVILASNVGGIPELISNEFLHFPGDANKLFNDLLLFINDKDLYNKVSSVNFERSKYFDAKLLKNKKKEFIKEFYENNRKK